MVLPSAPDIGAIVESGEALDEIAKALQQPQAKGRGNFRSADLLGNAGRRMLPSVASGEGRANVVNFLENRRAWRRVSDALAEGFDAPEAAAQTEQNCRR